MKDFIRELIVAVFGGLLAIFIYEQVIIPDIKTEQVNLLKAEITSTVTSTVTSIIINYEDRRKDGEMSVQELKTIITDTIKDIVEDIGEDVVEKIVEKIVEGTDKDAWVGDPETVQEPDGNAIINDDEEPARHKVANGGRTVQDKDKETALYWAALEGRTYTAQKLLNHGADVNAQNKHGITALHVAAVGGHTNTDTNMVQVLLKHGADINARDDNESPPLHWAVEGGHIDTVRALLNHGADVHARNKYGDTALDVAEIMKGDIEIIRLLKQHGAR